MLIRNVVRVVSKIIQNRRVINYHRSFPFQKFVYQPSYSFFFNGKSDKDKMKQNIENLYEKMSECDDETQEMEYLKQIIEIREAMEENTEKKCILLLLDKIELAKYQIENTDEDSLDEIFEDDFEDNIHFNNVELSRFPKMYSTYLKNCLVAALIPLKFIKLYEENEMEEIQNWLGQYLTSINYVRDYLILNYEEIGEEEGFIDIEQVQAQFLYNLSFYNEMSGKFFIDECATQQAINFFEQALQEAEKFMAIARKLSEQDGDVAQEGERMKEKGLSKIAEIIEQLGLVQIELDDAEAARPYFEKAAELFLQVYGKHSYQYASCYCELATTYQHTDIQKSEEMLRDYNEYLDDCQDVRVTLEVKMNLFIILEKQKKGEEDLLIFIIDKLQGEIVDNLLTLEFNIQALKYLNREKESIEIDQSYILTMLKQSIDTVNQYDDKEFIANKLFDIIDLIENLSERDKFLGELLLPQVYQIFQQGNLVVIDDILQYKIDRQQGFLQFKIREDLNLESDECLQDFLIFFQRWIKVSFSIEQLLDDTDEMIQLILDEKMLTLAHKALKKIVKIMEKYKQTHPELIDEALVHYRQQIKNLYEQMNGQ